MFFSAGDFQIHKYGQKYCLNDVVSQCELSTNPKEYIKKIDDKILHNGNYRIALWAYTPLRGYTIYFKPELKI